AAAATMSYRRLLAAVLAAVTVAAPAQDTGAPAADPAASAPTERAANPQLELLQRKIAAGQATLAEVREALTDTNIAALTNTMHALYSMRWHRGVYNLLHDMWAGRRDTFPEIQWEQFSKPPVRLGLASTLLRMEPLNREYLQYLRDHRQDEHEFHRAQVAIGLGFKAAVEDVDYIYSMAAGDNVFVAQTAIT